MFRTTIAAGAIALLAAAGAATAQEAEVGADMEGGGILEETAEAVGSAVEGTAEATGAAAEEVAEDVGEASEDVAEAAGDEQEIEAEAEAE